MVVVVNGAIVLKWQYGDGREERGFQKKERNGGREGGRNKGREGRRVREW